MTSIVKKNAHNKHYSVNAGSITSIDAEKKLLNILSGAKVKIEHTADYDVIETYDPMHDVTSFKVSNKEEEQE